MPPPHLSHLDPSGGRARQRVARPMMMPHLRKREREREREGGREGGRGRERERGKERERGRGKLLEWKTAWKLEAGLKRARPCVSLEQR